MLKILWTLVCVFLVTSLASAQDTTAPFSFNNEDLTKIVETYSKWSGTKFISDGSFRGKATILNNKSVSLAEAYNDLSTALALNGYAISKRDEALVIQSARNAQRSLIEVSNEVPSLKPERMATWVVTLKYVAAGSVNRELRILTSKDGEMSVSGARNQLIISDFTSNLQRIAELIKRIDIPADTKVAKLVEENKKRDEENMKNHMKMMHENMAAKKGGDTKADGQAPAAGAQPAEHEHH